jgi:hypothetical protein
MNLGNTPRCPMCRTDIGRSLGAVVNEPEEKLADMREAVHVTNQELMGMLRIHPTFPRPGHNNVIRTCRAFAELVARAGTHLGSELISYVLYEYDVRHVTQSIFQHEFNVQRLTIAPSVPAGAPELVTYDDETHHNAVIAELLTTLAESRVAISDERALEIQHDHFEIVQCLRDVFLWQGMLPPVALGLISPEQLHRHLESQNHTPADPHDLAVLRVVEGTGCSSARAREVLGLVEWDPEEAIRVIA